MTRTDVTEDSALALVSWGMSLATYQCCLEYLHAARSTEMAGVVAQRATEFAIVDGYLLSSGIEPPIARLDPIASALRLAAIEYFNGVSKAQDEQDGERLHEAGLRFWRQVMPPEARTKADG